MKHFLCEIVRRGIYGKNIYEGDRGCWDFSGEIRKVGVVKIDLNIAIDRYINHCFIWLVPLIRHDNV